MNMLKAIFMDGIDEITIHGLTQWDRGQKLQIVLSSLPASFQVHFANRRDEIAYVVEATAANGVATVAIPNVVLQKHRDAIAWIYLTDGDSGETVKIINLPIQARTKPSDYVYTEDALKIIDYEALENRIVALEKGGSGITDAEKSLILTLFRNAAYTSPGMVETLSRLENLWNSNGESEGGSGDDSGDDTHAHNYVDGVCSVCGAADPDYNESVTYVTPPCTLPTDNIVPGYIGNGGVVTAMDGSYIANTFIKVKPGGTYSVDATSWFNTSTNKGNLIGRYAWYSADGSFVSRSNVTITDVARTQNITAPGNAEYVILAIGTYLNAPDEETLATLFNNITISEVA